MNKNELLKFIDDNRAECVQLEKILTSHKALAPENGGNGEWEKCAALEDFLRSHGITNLERFDAPDERALHGRRPNLVATIPGKKDDYKIWVIAHLDVVPVGNFADWKTDPWTLVEKDGKLFGRGVEDDQQGLCSAFAAAWAFVANNIQPERTIKLLFAADEEVGSKYGMIWLLQKHPELFNKKDFFLIPDGGDSEGRTIEVAEKNVLWLEFTVQGIQTHGSRPDQGLNACFVANRFSMTLYDSLHKEFNASDQLFEPASSTFEPTKRAANVDGVNIIPGKETFCFDCRILPRYKNQEVLKKIDELIAEEEAKSGAKISYTLLQNAESKATDKNSPVVKALACAIKEAHGIDAKTIGIGGGTVAAELRNLGYDCVVWSTLDEMAHMPNEYCVVDNLIKDAKTLALMFAAAAF